MQEILSINRIELDSNEVNSVSTRELYEFLEVKNIYANWIKKRLDQLGAIENEDYIKILFLQKEKKNSGRRGYDYIVGTDIAKHLSMMERNEKGRQARQYFIEVEKVVNNSLINSLPKGLSYGLDSILPDLKNLGKQNKKGLPRTKLIAAYFKVDLKDGRTQLYKDIYRLRELHDTGLFDLEGDIEAKVIEIKEYENKDLIKKL